MTVTPGEHGQGGPPVPGRPAADLVFVQSGQPFGGLEVLRDLRCTSRRCSTGSPQNLRRVLGYEVQYFATIEPQRRLAPHVHVAMRGTISRTELQSRTVPLPRFLAAEIAAAVAGKHADQLVFTMPGGGVMRLPNWRHSVFVSARRRAGLSDRFRVHDLRHTAASLMIQAGYPPKMLQEIMGHASITTTLDLYGHLYPGEMDRYADRLNEAAGMTDAANKRPDGTDGEVGSEGSTC